MTGYNNVAMSSRSQSRSTRHQRSTSAIVINYLHQLRQLLVKVDATAYGCSKIKSSHSMFDRSCWKSVKHNRSALYGIGHYWVSKCSESIWNLNGSQLPGWPSTGVPDRAMPLRDWHSSKAQPSVIVPGSAPGPSISEGTIREKRFLRLLITAVELASCRHPTSPQRASTFPEETQNSLYATVHVMPLRIYVNSVNSTTTSIYIVT